MLDEKTIQIGDDQMMIRSLPATKALVLLAKMTKTVGGVAKGIKDIPSAMEEVEQALHMGMMLEGVLEKIDPEASTTLIKSIVQDSVISPSFEGKNPGDAFNTWYEMRFSRNIMDLFSLVKEILVHNYGEPLEWLGKITAHLEGMGLLKPSVPQQPETSEAQNGSKRPSRVLSPGTSKG